MVFYTFTITRKSTIITAPQFEAAVERWDIGTDTARHVLNNVDLHSLPYGTAQAAHEACVAAMRARIERLHSEIYALHCAVVTLPDGELLDPA